MLFRSRTSDWIGLGGTSKLTEDERNVYDRLQNLANECEIRYDDEDTEYLIRLIKLRHSLWT